MEVGFAILAVIFFSLFTRFYKPIAQKAGNDPTISAAVLYCTASGLLAILVGGFAAMPGFGWHLELPDGLRLFGKTALFGGSFGLIFGMLALMAVGYAVHIAADPRALSRIDIGLYALLFQVNTVVIGFLDHFVNGRKPSFWGLVGGLIVLSAAFLLVAAIRKGAFNRTVPRSAIAWAIGSAAACGTAIFVDGEIGQNLIFQKNGLVPDRLAAFFFYEFLTFFLPACLVFLIIFGQNGRLAFERMRTPFDQNRHAFLLSAAFSVGQFVFSVLALSLSKSKFSVAVILGLAPLLSIFLDKNLESGRPRNLAFLLALMMLAGVTLTIVHRT